MCETKEEVQTKLDRLIRSMDRLSAAIAGEETEKVAAASLAVSGAKIGSLAVDSLRVVPGPGTVPPRVAVRQFCLGLAAEYLGDAWTARGAPPAVDRTTEVLQAAQRLEAWIGEKRGERRP